MNVKETFDLYIASGEENPIWVAELERTLSLVKEASLNGKSYLEVRWTGDRDKRQWIIEKFQSLGFSLRMPSTSSSVEEWVINWSFGSAYPKESEIRSGWRIVPEY